MNASYDIAQLRALYDAPHHHPGDPAKERARDPALSVQMWSPLGNRAIVNWPIKLKYPIQSASE